MPLDATAISAHAIQLAIAPVFLLTGIAGLLGVMANRLARVVDRARYFEMSWSKLDDAVRASLRVELVHLEERRRLASWSINFCTAAALVIVALFVEEFFAVNVRWVAGVLFVLALMCLIGGLFTFLREVYLATHSVRIDLAQVERAERLQQRE